MFYATRFLSFTTYVHPQVHNSQNHILHVKVIIVIFISCNVLHMPCQIYLSSSIYAFNMYCREHERTKNTNMLNASKIGVSYLLRATRTSFRTQRTSYMYLSWKMMMCDTISNPIQLYLTARNIFLRHHYNVFRNIKFPKLCLYRLLSRLQMRKCVKI